MRMNYVYGVEREAGVCALSARGVGTMWSVSGYLVKTNNFQ